MRTVWDRSILKHLREKKGLNHTQVAAHIGVIAQTVANWEEGYGEPKASQVIALIELFGCAADTFLREAEEPVRNGA